MVGVGGVGREGGCGLCEGATVRFDGRFKGEARFSFC